jgi:hypothetical protein
MNERVRELVFVVVVLALMAGGIAIDALASGVAAPSGEPPDGGIEARAVFCPPTSSERGSVLRVAAASGTDREAVIGIEPVAPEPAQVPAGGSLVARIPAAEGDGSVGAAQVVDNLRGESAEVIGYGEPVTAGGLLSAAGPVRGAAAAPCSSVAASEWFFAAGSAALDTDQRILLYNPFPDEAVIRLSLYTPRGLETKTSLQEVPVPARTATAVIINEAIRVRGTVGARVVAKRGRVVAWREMFTQSGDRPRSVQMSLGTPRTADTWYFADGGLGPGVNESIGILNPGGREAIVSVTVTTSEETLQPRKLLEYPVPRHSAVEVRLEDFVREPDAFAGASVTVKSVNGVSIAAERTVYYATNAISGGTAEAGATSAHERWVLPPAAASPDDDAVTLMNPSSGPVTVDLTVLGLDGPRAPDALQGIKIGPGSRRKLQVQNYIGGRALPVLAVGTGPFVAERYAYSPNDEDVSMVLGVPRAAPD